MSRQVVCFNTVEKVSTLCVFTDSFIDVYVSLLYFPVQLCGAESDLRSINPRRSPEGHLGEIFLPPRRKMSFISLPCSRQETSFSDPDSFCSDILTLECTENSRYDTSSFVTSLCETIHPAISGTEPWVMSLLTKISIYDRWCLQFWMFVQTDGLSLRPFEWLWLLVITVFIVRLAE